MARLQFPQDRAAFVYQGANAPILTPPRTGLTVYLDQAKTTLANIQTPSGTTIPQSTIYTDQGLLPEFLGPDGLTRVWAAVPNAPAYPLDAQVESLLENSGVVGTGVSQLKTTATAAAALSGHRVVTPLPNGQVNYASNDTLAHLTVPLWITTGAAAPGTPVEVIMAGAFTEPSWSWTPGSAVYLGAAGVLTQTPPTAPTAQFLAQVGVATSATAVYVDRNPSIKLI